MGAITSRNLRRATLLLHAGTAMSLLMAGSAYAEPVIQYADGDIAIDEDSASGTPIAVDVYSTSGNVTATIGTVTATAADDAREDVVYIGAGGTGSIVADIGSITATGGNLRGGLFETEAGDIDLTVGTVTLVGLATAGVHAFSDTGNVLVQADDVQALGTGSDPNFKIYPEAVLAYSAGGAATAIVGNAETFGLYGSAVIAYAGTDAVIEVDTATAHSNDAVAVQANGVNSASVNAGSVTMTGVGTAVEGFSSGNVAIDVDTVNSGGLGIYGTSPTSIDITAGDVTAARGIYANGGTTAESSVTLNGTIVTSVGYAIYATGDIVDVTMAEGASIDSVGRGILAESQSSVSVTAHDIDSDYTAVRASAVSGPVDVNITGDLTSVLANAISINGQGVNVTIAEGAVVTSYAGSASLAAGGGAGDMTIVNDGEIVALENAAGGIGVSATNVSIESNIVRLESEFDPVSPYNSGGINADALGGDVSINANLVTVAGQGRNGINATAIGSGNIAITADTVSITADDRASLRGLADGGDVMLTGTTISTSGNGALGAYGFSNTGDVTIAIEDVTTTGLEMLNDHASEGALAESASGFASVTVGTANIAGFGASGAVALGGAGAEVITEDVTIAGQYAVANYAYSVGGSSSVDTDVTDLAGESQWGVLAYGLGGDAMVTSGSITDSGTDGRGIYAVALNDVSIVSGTVETENQGIRGVSNGDGMVDIQTTGDTLVATNWAIRAAGGDVTVGTGEGTMTRGGTHGVWVQTAGSAAITNEGTIESAGLAVMADGGNGIDNPGSLVRVFNEGTINGTGAEAAIQMSGGTAYLLNDGTINAASGIALSSTATDTTVELTENSAINGELVAGDAGFDRISLDVTDGSGTTMGDVAASAGFELLDVETGYWVAETGNSVYETVEIADGATLEIRQADGYAAVVAPLFSIEGDLALNFDTDTDPGDLSGITLEGTGGLRLIGTADVLADDASGLQHSGGTYVENGTLILTDAYAGTIVTSGDGIFQLGDGVTSGDFTGDLVNDGSFVFAQDGDYTFTGDLTGTGSLEKYGEGQLIFAGEYAFDGLSTIYGGSLALTGTLAEDTQLAISGGTFDLSQVAGGAQTIASLSGTGGTLLLGETALTVIQTGTTSYYGDIVGNGKFIIDGTGDLKLTGDISFTGDALIQGGTLSVNGSMTDADFYVYPGGTLGGSGTVGDVTVEGGMIGAGNSIGTLTVVGDLTLDANSVFEIEVNAAGEADLVDVTGTATLGGATASILAEDGDYAPSTEYTVLTAGSVSGTFGAVTTNYAFLTPEFAYSADNVTLTLTRNDIDFSDLGTTSNQMAIGGLVEDLAIDSPLFTAVLGLGEDEVADAFESLSGEAYPAFASATVETTDMLRRQMQPAAPEGDGVFGWGMGLLATARGGSAGYRDAHLDSKGVAGGIGYHAGA